MACTTADADFAADVAELEAIAFDAAAEVATEVGAFEAVSFAVGTFSVGLGAGVEMSAFGD